MILRYKSKRSSPITTIAFAVIAAIGNSKGSAGKSPDISVARPVEPVAPAAVDAPTSTPSLRREPRFKFVTGAPGMYRVTYVDVAEHARKMGDPRGWTLWCARRQVPMYVKGAGDGRFDPHDYIEWYAERIRSPFNRVTRGAFDNDMRMSVRDAYTTQGVYFLRFLTAGSPPPLHVRDVETTVVLKKRFWENRTFRRTRRWAPDLIRRNFMADPGAEFTDGKFWDHFSWPSLTFRHHYRSLVGLAKESDEPVSMTVKLWGMNRPKNPAGHQARLSIGEFVVGQVRWPGVREYYFTTTTLSPAIFNEYATEFVLEPVPRETKDMPDMMLLDWIEVDYPSVYRAENDRLEFVGPPIPTDLPDPWTGWLNPLSLETFTSEPVAVLDRTSGEVQHLPTSMHWRFRDQSFYNSILPVAREGHRYIAYSPAGVRRPVSVRWVSADRLRARRAGAEYLVITHEKFLDEAQRLADHRSKLGLSSLVTTTEEIADGFHEGFESINGIKALIQHAYHNWTPRPRFVVLIGDASWDDLGVQGGEFANYLPTYYHRSTASYYASDNWFACVDGDDELPDVAIGRIPARTIAEARSYVDKVIEYDTAPAGGDWQQSAYLLSSFNPTSHRELGRLARDLFTSFSLTKCFTTLEMSRSEQLPTTVTKQFDLGHSVVVFAGHGGSFVWQVGGNPGGGQALDLFSPRHVANLANKGKYPVVFALTCYTNSFDNPMTQTIGESLILEPDKGAIGCISASWRGFLGNEFPFCRDTLSQFPGKPEMTIGEAFLAAKHVKQKRPENIHGICLLGDPAVRIYFEPRPNNLPKP